jgi:outer membrane protein, heavy metal efflux system
MLSILALLLFASASAGMAQAVTMDEAVIAALKNNSELQVLRYEDETAKAQLKKAQLLLPANPVLAGTLSKKEKPAEAGTGNYTNYGITLSQEFEVAGQRGLRVDLARKNLLRVGYQIRDRERILTYEVKEAFARALSLTAKVELTTKVVDLQEELVNFTRIKYRAGSVSGLEVNLAEIESGKAKRDLLSVKRELAETLFALQGLMGQKPEPAFAVNGKLSPDAYVMPEKEILLERAIERRPDVKASSAEVDMSDQAIDLIKREAIPNVVFGGFQFRDEERYDRGILLSVSIPLFDRKQAEKKGAEARASQARTRRSGLERTVKREIEDVYNNLSYALQELHVFKEEIINKSLDSLNLLNFAFKEGKISFFEVRTAQKDTLEMQFAYLDAILQAQRWIYAVERVAGGNIK